MLGTEWNGMVIVVGVALAVSGCQHHYDGPPTVPVQGKVVFTDGGDVSALADRQVAVIFNSVEDPKILAYGELKPDGSFKLATVKDKLSHAGAIVGQHRVRLQIDDGADRFVAAKFGKFETSGLTAHVPATSDIVLEVKQGL